MQRLQFILAIRLKQKHKISQYFIIKKPLNKYKKPLNYYIILNIRKLYLSFIHASYAHVNNLLINKGKKHE